MTDVSAGFIVFGSVAINPSYIAAMYPGAGFYSDDTGQGLGVEIQVAGGLKFLARGTLDEILKLVRLAQASRI